MAGQFVPRPPKVAKNVGGEQAKAPPPVAFDPHPDVIQGVVTPRSGPQIRRCDHDQGAAGSPASGWRTRRTAAARREKPKPPGSGVGSRPALGTPSDPCQEDADGKAGEPVPPGGLGPKIRRGRPGHGWLGADIEAQVDPVLHLQGTPRTAKGTMPKSLWSRLRLPSPAGRRKWVREQRAR